MRARQDVDAFREARVQGLPPEIAGTHIQDATLALEDLLGAVSTEGGTSKHYDTKFVPKTFSSPERARGDRTNTMPYPGSR